MEKAERGSAAFGEPSRSARRTRRPYDGTTVILPPDLFLVGVALRAIHSFKNVLRRSERV